MLVLYVDDEADIREVVEYALEDEDDITLILCDNGEEAIEINAKQQPELILLDVMMPKMDGPETLRRIRTGTTNQDVPIAFITAKIQRTEVAFLKSLGVVDVIEKPFDPLALADRIRQIWEKCRG
jgi:two-component system, OmpR family, response regulator